MLALIAPPAEAAPYRPSCTSGVLAPQLCTLVLSAVTTRIAGVNQYAVVTHVRTDRDYRACQGGWRESYAGRVRTSERFDNSPGLADVSLTLWGCPGAHPTVAATTNQQLSGGGAWQVSMYIGPEAGGAAVTFTDDWEDLGRGGWDDLTQTDGALFRRDTGVRAGTTGNHHWCDDMDRGSPSHGCLSYADSDVTINFDSSISGHWARFYITSFGKGEKDQSSRESRSEPYGNGGWKITRVS